MVIDYRLKKIRAVSTSTTYFYGCCSSNILILSSQYFKAAWCFNIAQQVWYLPHISCSGIREYAVILYHRLLYACISIEMYSHILYFTNYIRVCTHLHYVYVCECVCASVSGILGCAYPDIYNLQKTLNFCSSGFPIYNNIQLGETRRRFMLVVVLI